MLYELSEQYRALDLLIVPSPILNDEGTAFPAIDPTTGLYVGGHLRMSAAAEFSLQYRPAKVVVVGGLNPKQGPRMTQAMAQFILEKNSGANVQRVNSLPCTRHNVIAIFDQLRSELAGKRIGVLSNSYHLPRFLAFWTKLRPSYGGNIPDPLAILAESCCLTRGPVDQSASEARIAAEQRGLADLGADRYVDRCLAQLATFGDELVRHPEFYLSPDEQKRFRP
jgi:hypothetical protein